MFDEAVRAVTCAARARPTAFTDVFAVCVVFVCAAEKRSLRYNRVRSFQQFCNIKHRFTRMCEGARKRPAGVFLCVFCAYGSR